MRIYKWHEFHNDVEASIRLPNAVFSLASRKAKTTVPPHGHEGGAFICLIHGRHHWHGTDGMIHWTIPGAWYFRSRKDVHSHEACPTLIRCVGINFDPSAYGFDPELSAEMIETEDAARITAKIRAEFQQESQGRAFLLEGLLLELMGLFLNEKRKEAMPNDHLVVRRATTILTERFGENHSLEELSAEVGVHRSHLARLFRKHLGVSVGEFVRDRRLEWGYQQLLSSDAKIAVVAAEAGFADHAHFCRLFKARYGKAPSAIRYQSHFPG